MLQDKDDEKLVNFISMLVLFGILLGFGLWSCTYKEPHEVTLQNTAR